MKNKKYQFEIEENNVIRAAIAPMGIDFRPNTRFYMGDYICRIYAIMQYPPTQEYGWVSKINNIAGTIVNFTSTPITEANIVEQLSKIINASRAEAENTRDALQRQRKTKTADDTTRLMARMEENNEKIAKFCCTVMVMGNDEIDFEQKCNRVESIISGVGCKLRCLSRMQKDAWKHISPSYAPVELIGDVGNRPMPVNAFYGGFPFQNSGFNDGVGYYLGVDNDGTPIIFDLWKRDGARTNSNISIIGGSGKGKTTLIKHIIVSELIRGTKVIVIDPETEYKAICDMFREDGISRWIDACGGRNGMINPLQVRPKPLSDEEEEEAESKGISELALHLKTLEIFFELYLPELTQIQKALLTKGLIAMYEKFNITWDTSVTFMKNTDFPVMTDLYNTLLEQRKTAEKGVTDDMDKLILLLENITTGAESLLSISALFFNEFAIFIVTASCR